MSESPWQYPGARWWRFDFHTHTPASNDYGKGPDQRAIRQITPVEWLLGFMRAEVDCVAITDHNSGDWVDELASALAGLEKEGHPQYRPIHLFPGVEVTANGGQHILALFDTSRSSADITQLLGAVGFHGTRGASDTAAEASVIETIRSIVKAGAIPIPAHVDGPSGVFSQLSGNTLVPLLDSRLLYAMERTDRAIPLPEVYHQRKLSWSEVIGSDSHHPTGEAGSRFPGSHFSWVKMGTPTLEGLRLALLDGNDLSIRRSDDEDKTFTPFATPVHFIESVQISDARYMGRDGPEVFTFAPSFNTLIGGRGTGKSTVVHFLRLACRRVDELARIKDFESVGRTFDRFNHAPKNRMDHGGLSGDQSTAVEIVVMRDGDRHRLRWRQDGTGNDVEERQVGDWVRSSSQSITSERFPLLLFSQGQIAALASDGGHPLLEMIDQNAGTQRDADTIKDEERRYLLLRAQLRDLAGKIAGRDSVEIELADVRRKIDRIEQAHHAAVLRAYQMRSNQHAVILGQISAVDQIATRTGEFARGLTIDSQPADTWDSESDVDRTVIDILGNLNEQVRELAAAVQSGSAALSEFVNNARTAVETTAWTTAFNSARGEYEKIVAELAQQGVADPNEYDNLVRTRQDLENRLKGFDALTLQLKQVAQEADEALQRHASARRTLSDTRVQFLRVALADNNYVRIVIEPYGREASSLEQSLRDLLDVRDGRFSDDILVMDDDGGESGAVSELLNDLPPEYEAARSESERLLRRLRERLAACCDRSAKGTFGGHFENYLRKQFEQKPEFLDRILLWYPGDSLKIEYSPSGDGTGFRPIGQASAGQRAAAMLAFLLAHGDDPILLDQPEDDLDNHLIYDLVVKQIRSNKQRRQIIAITHNPNIVVNGDAEMIHVLDFRRGQCRVVEHGCLQDPPMRQEVCRVIEGGPEAFEKRWNRLGRNT